MWAWLTVEVAANKNLRRRGGERRDGINVSCKDMSNLEMTSIHLD